MQVKRKPFLITNATRHNLFQVEAFIQRAKLFGSYIIIPADDFTDDILRLTNRYNLTVLVAVSCTDEGPDSVTGVEVRNPGFEQRLTTHPTNKLIVVHPTDEYESTAPHLISLAASFPKHRLMALQAGEAQIGFHNTKVEFFNIVQNTEDFKELDAEFVSSLSNLFDVVDYQLLSNIGIIGGSECSLTLK